MRVQVCRADKNCMSTDELCQFMQYAHFIEFTKYRFIFVTVHDWMILPSAKHKIHP